MFNDFFLDRINSIFSFVLKTIEAKDFIKHKMQIYEFIKTLIIIVFITYI